MYSELQPSRLSKLARLGDANQVQLVVFGRLIIILLVKVCLPCLSLIKVTNNMLEFLHKIQKTFSPVSSINRKTDISQLPVKTSKPNFVTFFVYFGNSLFEYL